MTTRGVMVLLLTAAAIVGLAACGRDANRAENAQGAQTMAALATQQPINQGQVTPQSQPQQPAEQPTTALEPAQQIAPTNTPEPPPVELTNPPAESEQPEAVPTEVAIPPVGDTAAAVREAWSRAYELPAGVPFAVTITEAQLEAMIAEAMARSGYGSSVSSIDVTLNNGQIGVAFTLTLSQKVGPKTVNVSGTATVVFNAAIDANGKLALTVAGATVSVASGPQISIPPEMLTVLNVTLSEAITGASGSAEVEVTLTEITISGGTMTVKGYVTP